MPPPPGPTCRSKCFYPKPRVKETTQGDASKKGISLKSVSVTGTYNVVQSFRLGMIVLPPTVFYKEKG